MHQLDFFTIVIVSAVNFLLAAMGLFFIHSLKTGSGGIRRCIIACLLISIGIASLSMNLMDSPRANVVPANILFGVGGVCLLDGLRAFRGFRRPVRTYAALAATYAFGFSWFLFVHDDVRARFAIGSLFLGTLALFGFVTMAFRVPRRDRKVYWSTAGALGLHAGTLCTRAVMAFGGAPVLLYQPSMSGLIDLITLNILGLGCAFGLSVATIRRLQHRAEELALRDGLTNLPNRRSFEDRLEKAEQHARLTGKGIALIYCDVDNFKTVNDTLGHERGDQALRAVALRLRQLLAKDTFLARVGGDEFVVLLENAPTRQEVLALVEKLRTGLDGDPVFERDFTALGISCGFAALPDDVSKASDLIRVADAGMYQMKKHNFHKPVARVQSGNR